MSLFFDHLEKFSLIYKEDIKDLSKEDRRKVKAIIQEVVNPFEDTYLKLFNLKYLELVEHH